MVVAASSRVTSSRASVGRFSHSLDFMLIQSAV
jgi:hypothetical protein